MSKRKITIAAAVILLLTVGTVWARRSRPDPQVEKFKQMQVEMFKEGVTPAQRREKMTEFRKEIEELSLTQRAAIGQNMREMMERRMDERIQTYFSLPPSSTNRSRKWRNGARRCSRSAPRRAAAVAASEAGDLPAPPMARAVPAVRAARRPVPPGSQAPRATEASTRGVCAAISGWIAARPRSGRSGPISSPT